MLEFLRKAVGITSLEDKVKQYISLQDELNVIKSENDELAMSFKITNDNFQKSLQCSDNKCIYPEISKRYTDYFKDHTTDISKASAKYNSVNKRITKLESSSKEFKKAVGDYKAVQAYSIVKRKYKDGSLSSNQLNLIIKAKSGTISYADMCVFDSNGKILILQRTSDSDFAPNTWCLPGGHVDLGENFDIAAKRELQEETGLEVKKCEKIGEYRDSKSTIEYHSSNIEEESPIVVLENSEHSDYKWIELTEFLEDESLVGIMNLKDNLKKIYFPYQRNVEIIKKGLESGILSWDNFEKAGGHKYLRREGSKGNYTYVYAELHGTDGGHVEEEKKKTIGTDYTKLKHTPQNKEDAISEAKSLLPKIEGVKYDFSGYSGANGQSVYFKAYFKDKEIKVRISDHSVSNIDRMRDEINFNFNVKKYNLNQSINHLAYSLGVPGYEYGEIDIPGYSGGTRKRFGYSKTTSKSIEIIKKALSEGKLSNNIKEQLLEKARTGVYSDTAQNRQLKRVGQKYGAVGKQDTGSSPKDKKQEDATEKKISPKELDSHAKEASGSALEAAAKEASDEKIRIAAHKELDRREKEEKVPEEETPKKEEKDKTTPDKVSEKKKEDKSATKSTEEPETKEEIEAAIKKLRDADIDYSDEKALDENLKQIKDLQEKRKQVLENEKGLRKVEFEEYRKGFKSFNDEIVEGKDAVMAHRKSVKSHYEKESNNLSATDQELADIADYVGENYSYVRQFLSDPEGYKKEYGDDALIQPMIDGISSFITKNKIKENISLNRRVKGEGVDFFRNLKEGNVYEDKSFSSTSLMEQSIFGDFNIEILAKKGSSVANINNDMEFEYLIDKGSKFRVLKTSEKGIIVELL